MANELARQRAAMSDVWLDPLTELNEKILKRHYREAADIIAEGRSIPQATVERWARELYSERERVYLTMAMEGWGLAGAELAPRSGMARLAGKADFPPLVDPALVHWRVQEGVADVLRGFSELEARSSAEYIAEHVRRLRASDELLTSREIARRLTDNIPGLTLNRAISISRTASIWTYNEGAEQRYAEAGVHMVEWLTTDDDLLCESCEAMQGVRTSTGQPFFAAGERLETDTRSLDFDMDIRHPPLHPRCRCALIPVLDT